MNRLLAPALITLALAFPAAAETRNVGGFDSINAADGVHVIVQTGPSAVSVTGPDAGRVLTELDGHTLRIRDRNRPWFGTHHLNATVQVSMPRVAALASSRGADVRATNINADALSLAVSMGADMDVSGACQSLHAAVSMGASLDADALHCDNADVSASMGASASVYAARTYNASASMGGDVSVVGAGARGHVATSMGGSVTQSKAD